MNEAQARNFKRWPILGEEIWRSPAGARQRDTYQKEIDYLKDYLQAHMEWMDAELSYFTHVKADEAQTLKIRLFPNPMRSNAEFSYQLKHDADVRLRVYNVLGQVVATLVDGYQLGGTHAVRWDGRDAQNNSVANGLYFYELHINSQRYSAKFLKF